MKPFLSLNQSKWLNATCLVSASLLLSACGAESRDVAVPITKPRAELQSEVYLTKPLAGASYSRLYAYGDVLFATVKDEGLQVIDNTNPSTPKATNFVSIPGAKDVIIDGDKIVTNQYSDLVVLSISQEKEVGRINDLYNYEDYIDIPRGVIWKKANILANHVVVGYEIETEDTDNDICLLFCF